MTTSGRTQFPPRAPRVTLPECVFAIIELENGRKLPAKLQRISRTGGLLDLARYLEERIPVSLTLPVGSGIVHTRAEMLFPLRTATGYLQPFRITSIHPEQLLILEREISELLKHAQVSLAARRGLGVRPPSFMLDRS